MICQVPVSPTDRKTFSNREKWLSLLLGKQWFKCLLWQAGPTESFESVPLLHTLPPWQVLSLTRRQSRYLRVHWSTKKWAEPFTCRRGPGRACYGHRGLQRYSSHFNRASEGSGKNLKECRDQLCVEPGEGDLDTRGRSCRSKDYKRTSHTKLFFSSLSMPDSLDTRNHVLSPLLHLHIV